MKPLLKGGIIGFVIGVIISGISFFSAISYFGDFNRLSSFYQTNPALQAIFYFMYAIPFLCLGFGAIIGFIVEKVKSQK
jgi:hypothetical protein